LDIELLRPLMAMGLAFAALFFTLYSASIKKRIWRRALISQHRLAARAAVLTLSVMLVTSLKVWFAGQSLRRQATALQVSNSDDTRSRSR
jgi:hypothetical protein